MIIKPIETITMMGLLKIYVIFGTY